MLSSCSLSTVCNPPRPMGATGAAGWAKDGGGANPPISPPGAPAGDAAVTPAAGCTLMLFTMNPCGDDAKLDSTPARSWLKQRKVTSYGVKTARSLVVIV